MRGEWSAPSFKYIYTRTGQVVLQLDLAVQVVGSGPGLSEGDALGLVSILGLEITDNDTGLVVTLTVDLEGLFVFSQSLCPFFLHYSSTYHTVGGGGLDLKLDTTNGIVLGQKVLGGLANIVEGDYLFFQ